MRKTGFLDPGLLKIPVFVQTVSFLAFINPIFQQLLALVISNRHRFQTTDTLKNLVEQSAGQTFRPGPSPDGQTVVSHLESHSQGVRAAPHRAILRQYQMRPLQRQQNTLRRGSPHARISGIHFQRRDHGGLSNQPMHFTRGHLP